MMYKYKEQYLLFFNFLKKTYNNNHKNMNHKNIKHKSKKKSKLESDLDDSMMSYDSIIDTNTNFTLTSKQSDFS
jgi:hypothetical protein